MCRHICRLTGVIHLSSTQNMCSKKINYSTAKTAVRVELRAYVSSHQQLLMCERNRKNKPTNLVRLVVKVVYYFAKKIAYVQLFYDLTTRFFTVNLVRSTSTVKIFQRAE